MSAARWWEGPEAQRVMPLFHDEDAERAADVVDALRAGGARLVEFTLRGPRALEVLAKLCARFPGAIGAGSVADPAVARKALDAGAAFVVGPNGHSGVAEVCSSWGVRYVPGCVTPTEFANARSWGCDLTKLFPAGSLGPSWLKALRGPLADLQVMPTGGVGLEDAATWLDAGAVCVGMGSELVRKDLLARGDMDALEDHMRHALEAVG